MRMTLPSKGRSHDSVLAEMRALKTGDADWQHGRVPLFVFKASDELSRLGRDAFLEFFSENALGGKRAFPSVKRMEDEVVEMALGLFNAPAEAQGFMSTGGTESIIQAVQTCRDWNRKRRGDARHRGNLVLPHSVHPAFNKAGKLMDLEVRRVPVGPDFRADVAALDAAIDADTIMLVGSAPSFPYGAIDPIAELGRLAERRGVWLHVDACVGGYLAPFVRQIGREIPDFDFTVPQVASLSADLHKFGFCPKPASTVFYRDADKAQHHYFDFSDWPSGRFLTGTLVGTRPAGGVAGAWATFQYLGVDGYRAIAAQLMEFVDAYKRGIEAIPGLYVLGKPHLSIVAFGSDEVDVFRVAEVMERRGWLAGLVQRPKAIHRMMSMIQAPVLNEYLDEVKAALQVVRAEGAKAAGIEATY
ncbi:MAG: pyridoxal phosphate-dependent decarboxylase family protein [Caldimonas sp.]